MLSNNDLYIYQNRAHDIIMYIAWILYIAMALGLSSTAPQYLENLQSFIKLYVSLFLIYRFNPLRHVKFTELDSKIVFTSGIFLLTTTAIDRIIKSYLSELKEYIKIFREAVNLN
jgi:hypothetical protein